MNRVDPPEVAPAAAISREGSDLNEELGESPSVVC